MALIKRYTNEETRAASSLQLVVRNPQSGYALVALLAFMTVLALFAIAAAPNVRQQAQRDREKEAVFRGEEVASAIRAYVEYRNTQGVRGTAALPTSMDQLLEGLPRGTHKIQILRAEAAVDPLSNSGEWKLISPTSKDFIQFLQSVAIYGGGTLPTPRGVMTQFPLPVLVNVLDAGSTETAPGGEESEDNITGPFIGVASRSKRDSVITYYGIERHDEWIFTPIFR